MEIRKDGSREIQQNSIILIKDKVLSNNATKQYCKMAYRINSINQHTIAMVKHAAMPL